MNNGKQLDEALLNGYLLALSKGVIAQMLDIYIVQSSVYLDEIASSTRYDAQHLWQIHCHKMKGAAASIGFKQVYGKLTEIEKSTDLAQVKIDNVNELKRLNQQAINAYKQWLLTC
jgi:HPt (histidine-containing phosphotransfer) domain-containing protein